MNHSLSHSAFKQIEKGVLQKLSRHGNLILVAALAAVLAMMIVPLPPLFLDFLLAINIVGAVTLLTVALFITDSMKISSFPSLLLITTLFRLGLNIASTRMILSQGYAGEIILTFGNFAAGGNLVVGGILFLILTLIQFIVIAKGSERVAEVAARFTLDALPGKQMSIDADLRAGLLSQEEAKGQREALHRESKMYGAMDGAMKFVKGDAIAGLVIVVVNILAGMGTGVLQRGLSLTDALQTYSILTIGDGLVSQIPSLLVAMTAGFIVTRVADEKNEQSLGGEIATHLTSQPKALLMAASLAFLMGMIPGFPLFIFWMIAGLIAASAFYLMIQIKRKMSTPSPLEHYMVESSSLNQDSCGMAVPLVLEVGPELYQVFKTDPRWTHHFGALYPKLKHYLSNQMGVVYPDLKLNVSPLLAHSFRYRIRIHEVPVDHGILTPHQCSLLGNSSTLLEQLSEKPDTTTETVHGTPVAHWNLDKKEALHREGAMVYGPEEMLLRHVARVIKKHSGDFIGIQEVRDALNRLEMNFPELVREVIPKMMSIQKLTEILKRLVEEGVPIKDLRLILQTLSCAQPETKDPVTLTEQVRIGLKRTITFMHVREGNRLNALTLSPEMEDEIRGGIQKNGSECYLALAPERVRLVTESVKQTLWERGIHSSPCVLLTHLEIRRYLRKIIEDELPDLAVLSFQELDPKVVIDHIAAVSLETSPDLVCVNQ